VEGDPGHRAELTVDEALALLGWQNLPLGDPFFHLLAATSDGDATSLPINPSTRGK
jgi:hypothetical protein